MTAARKNRRAGYSREQIEFLAAAYKEMKVADVTAAFNERFGLSKTTAAINSVLKRHRIRCGRKHAGRLAPRRIYSEEQAGFIRENYASRSAAELTELCNALFGTAFTRRQIKTFVQNNRIKSGRTGCFPKGHKPWNAGTKGRGLTGANRGSFRKGAVPANRKPLWTERIGKNGFVEMKVPEKNPYTGAPTRYRHKQVYLWEQAHGSVPAGMVVSFVDGDQANFELGNLMLISRAVLLVLNQFRYKVAPKETKPAILALAKLRVKIHEKVRGA